MSENKQRAGSDAVTFRMGAWWGELDAAHHSLTTWQDTVLRLVDPGSAQETIHWGRNYLYQTRIDGPDGPVDVVVKQFRNQGWRNRLRRQRGGSKAQRSWRMARAFRATGVATARPLALIESVDPEGPSFFVTERLTGAVEARYVFRAANAGTVATVFPTLDYAGFLEDLGALLRTMHEAGFFHRDLSIGNILLVPESAPRRALQATPQDQDQVLDHVHDVGARPRLFVIDLNRARQRKRLSLRERTRDLCRLALFRSEDRQRFLQAYWGPGRVGWVRRVFYSLCHHGFRAKIASKKGVRGLFRPLRDWLRPRRAHAHIPAAATDAGARDKIVWDALSDQPHQHAGRLQKLGVRMADLGSHVRTATTVLAAAPRILRRYRALKVGLGKRPVPWDGVGVCVRPHPTDSPALLQAIEDLGVSNILLRLHPWQEEHADEEALAQALHARGYDLTFALPQNRELVRDAARWRRSIETLGERFSPYGQRFQVGQAINRSKWGIWRYDEYFDLASAAAEILERQQAEVEILGPAVIDFELHVTAAVLNHPRCPLRFDALASLLYVDRRGAPENRQMGFDSVDKVVLCQAIAETARHCAPRSWITEVNWPLWEGPHSPAGRSVAVDEAAQADYLTRFYVLALATGLVERVYWWQLIARGYGLISPDADGALRRRASFTALATLARTLDGTVCTGRVRGTAPADYVYRFENADQGEIVVGWTAGEPHEVTIPSRADYVAEYIVMQDGEQCRCPGREAMLLMPSVQYVHLGLESVVNARKRGKLSPQ